MHPEFRSNLNSSYKVDIKGTLIELRNMEVNKVVMDIFYYPKPPLKMIEIKMNFNSSSLFLARKSFVRL
jgi:hypothetical protein